VTIRLARKPAIQPDQDVDEDVFHFPIKADLLSFLAQSTMRLK